MKRHHLNRTIGIVVCLIGATLMLNGNIFGARTMSIATIVGIVGISLISKSTRRLRG